MNTAHAARSSALLSFAAILLFATLQDVHSLREYARLPQATTIAAHGDRTPSLVASVPIVADDTDCVACKLLALGAGNYLASEAPLVRPIDVSSAVAAPQNPVRRPIDSSPFYSRPPPA